MIPKPALGSNVSGSVKKEVFQKLVVLGYALNRKADALKVATKVAEVTGWPMPSAGETHIFLVRFLNEFGDLQHKGREEADKGGIWTRPDVRFTGQMRVNIGRIQELRGIPSIRDGVVRK